MLWICLISLLLVAAPSLAGAGGLYINEYAAPSQGSANAGARASARDASTTIFNPAGMTRLDGHQVWFGSELLYSDIRFDQSSSAPVAGGDGGQQGGLVPAGGLGYVHDLADRWRLGLGLFSLSGASLDPSDGWTGRNQVTEISLLTVSIAPTVAYQLTDRLSVGGGPVIWYGLLDLKVRAPVLAEPTIKIEDADDWEVGWMAGALFEVNDRLRFGAQYLSEANLELSGDIKIPAGGVAANVDMEMDLAQLVAVSMYWDVTDRVALLMTADWEDWSTLSKIPVSVSSGSNDVPTGWGDTWKVGVGVNYQWRPDWMLQAGYSYDSSPVKSRDRNAMLPVDRQHRYAVGAQYQWSENTNVGFSVEYIDLGSSQIRASNLVGDYEDNQLWAFVGTVSWHRLPWDGHLRFGKKDWEK